MQNKFRMTREHADVLTRLSPSESKELLNAIFDSKEGKGHIFENPVLKVLFDWMINTEVKKHSRNDAGYEIFRTKVLERDEYTCQMCKAKNIDLHVHHIKPYAKYPELRTDPNNGITLCVQCHRDVHHYGITIKEGTKPCA